MKFWKKLGEESKGVFRFSCEMDTYLWMDSNHQQQHEYLKKNSVLLLLYGLGTVITWTIVTRNGKITLSRTHRFIYTHSYTHSRTHLHNIFILGEVELNDVRKRNYRHHHFQICLLLSNAFNDILFWFRVNILWFSWPILIWFLYIF